MDETVRKIKDKLDTIEDNWKYWTRLVIGVLVVQLLGGIIVAAVILIRLAPIIDKLNAVASI